jgi:ribosomal protein L12E/L44/L45/RPP1/RPP2
MNTTLVILASLAASCNEDYADDDENKPKNEDVDENENENKNENKDHDVGGPLATTK